MATVKIEDITPGAAMHVEAKIAEVLDAYAVEQETGHDRLIELGTQLAYAIGLAFESSEDARCRINIEDTNFQAMR